MTRVDFYILADPGIDASLRFACRLAAKLTREEHNLHIHMADLSAAQALDEMMWDYPRHRFVAHRIIQSQDASERDCRVHIGCEAPLHNDGVLVNLAPTVPTFFGRFDRVAEIIVGETKAAGRERFKHYRERGYPIYDHHLTDWEQAN